MSKEYTREIKDETSYTATWLPSMYLQLGDVGIMKDYQFQKRTSLSQLGITFSAGEPQAVADISLSSSGKVSIKFNTDAHLIDKGEVGIEINFGAANGIVFNATGCRSHVIQDLENTSRQILQAKQDNRWDPDFVVVNEVIITNNLSLFISNGSNAKVNLKAKVKEEKGLNLAKVNSSLMLESENNISTKIIAEGNITPLFRAVGIKKRIFRPDTVRDANHSSTADDYVVELDYEDFI